MVRRPDTTPRWLFAAAIALWLVGVVVWLVDLADRGTAAVFPQAPILVLVALAIYAALWSHRHPDA